MLEFDVAEVIDYDYTYSYIDPLTNPGSTNNLFAIKCRSCGTYFNLDPFLAKPSDMNMKRIPLIGEYVLIYRTYNQNASNTNRRFQAWYYLTTIDLQSNTNANILPGISKNLSQDEIDKIKPGKTFKLSDQSISPLQPYEGDSIIEGRFSNSLRFGSTVNLHGNSKHYTIPTPWDGSNGKQGDPIIILSNGRKNYPRKRFVSEDIQNDASSLYLTSTQKLPKLTLNTDIKTGESVSAFNKSQFIGVADRIILKSKTDSIILDSLKSIEINTPLLSVGISRNKENGLHSTETKDILNTILDIIKYGLIAGDSPVTINPALRGIFEQQLSDSFNTIDNKLIKQDKS